MSTESPYGTPNIPISPRTIPQAEQEIVTDILQEFSAMSTWRDNFAQQWEEVAALVRPESRNTFFYGSMNTPGQKQTQAQIDASGMIALHRFGAICDSMLTPRNMMWHQLKADNPYVMKDRAVRLWFEDVTNILFRYRYAPLANFTSQNQQNFQELGAFGNGAMFIDRLDGRNYHGARGTRYRSCRFGEMFFRENHQGQVDGFVRWFKLTAYQAVQKWGLDRLPPQLWSALKQHSQWKYDFLHCVRPRNNYDKERVGPKGMPFGSYYVCVDGRCLMAEEGGYRSLPIAPARYDQGPNEVYGRGPAMMVLPALKTLNAQKRTFLKQGHRAADPVLLTADDGIVDFLNKPGALNKGGMSADGKRLVDILPTGNIQINELMMEKEEKLIDDAFLVSLFKLILDEKVLTATQVTEIINQKGILIAPTLGRQQSEYLGPMIDRELDILADEGLLPPMPPLLVEAKGEYRVEYTSPLAKTQKAGEAAGFMRTVEIAKEITNITQDPGYLDPFDFDVALPAIADIQGVPESFMADARKIAQKRQNRARQQQVEQQIQAMPAQAAMMKAEAVQAKAGMFAQQQGPGPTPTENG